MRCWQFVPITPGLVRKIDSLRTPMANYPWPNDSNPIHRCSKHFSQCPSRMSVNALGLAVASRGLLARSKYERMSNQRPMSSRASSDNQKTTLPY